MNPDYVFGAELLERIAPPGSTAERAAVTVNGEFDLKSCRLDGIDCGASLLEQAKQAEKILRDKQPDKVIVFGGDCAVTS